MDEKGEAEPIGPMLACLRNILDEAERSLFARDGRRLARAGKTFEADAASILRPFEEACAKKGGLPAARRLLRAAVDLLRAARAALDADIPFTDNALSEMGEVMAQLRQTAGDTRDALCAADPRFGRYVASGTDEIVQRVDACAAGVEARLAAGLCKPAASLPYLDAMRSLKGVALDLASICRDA